MHWYFTKCVLSLSRYKNIIQFNTECCIAVDKGEELPEINRIKNEKCVEVFYSNAPGYGEDELG